MGCIILKKGLTFVVVVSFEVIEIRVRLNLIVERVAKPLN